MKTNAKSMAKLAAILANNGELDGDRLLSKEMIDKLNTDDSLSITKKFDRTVDNNIRGNTTFNGWDSACGSSVSSGTSVYWNSEKQFGFAYVINAMGDPSKIMDERALKLISTFYEIVESE